MKQVIFFYCLVPVLLLTCMSSISLINSTILCPKQCVMILEYHQLRTERTECLEYAIAYVWGIQDCWTAFSWQVSQWYQMYRDAGFTSVFYDPCKDHYLIVRLREC